MAGAGLLNECPDCQQWQLERELSLLEFPEDARCSVRLSSCPAEKDQVTAGCAVFAGKRFSIDRRTDQPPGHRIPTAGGGLFKGKKDFCWCPTTADFLDGCVDHILSLDRDGVQLPAGIYRLVRQDYQTRVQSEKGAERTARGLVELQTAARRTADWSGKVESSKIGEGPCDRGFIGHKAAKMMQRAIKHQSRREQAIGKRGCSRA